jgi:hypothetical protein
VHAPCHPAVARAQRPDCASDQLASRVAEAETGADQLPRLLWGAAIVLVVWLSIVSLLAWWLVSLAVSSLVV